jgi:hypothetical protein
MRAAPDRQLRDRTILDVNVADGDKALGPLLACDSSIAAGQDMRSETGGWRPHLRGSRARMAAGQADARYMPPLHSGRAFCVRERSLEIIAGSMQVARDEVVAA